MKSIDLSGLSVRAANCISNASIEQDWNGNWKYRYHTKAQLKHAVQQGEFLPGKIRNCGRKSCSEIYLWLGLSDPYANHHPRNKVIRALTLQLRSATPDQYSAVLRKFADQLDEAAPL
jgi:hypothetical protein